MKSVLPLLLLCVVLRMNAAESAKPWTFWYWMYGAVTEAGIRADLQAMKDVGLGGCYLMPIRGTAEAPANLPAWGEAPAQQLTSRFWELTDYAMQQADSLGLELGIHICDGFALAGGPWISPEESMQQVVWTDTIVQVKTKETPMPAPALGPGGYYEDIAVFACPVWGTACPPHPIVSGTIPRDENGTFRSKEPGYIQYDYAEPQTIRSIEIIPSGNNVQSQRLMVQASDDGENYRDIRRLLPPRQGWQNTDQDYTYALPETTARHFRFVWTPEGTEPGAEDLDAAKWSPVLKVKDIRLSTEPCIDQYESKNGSVWRIAAPYESVSDNCPMMLTASTTLPPGRWRIVRFGHVSTGHTNATAGGGKGLECDKFSVTAVKRQIDNWFGAFMQRPHHHVVKYMHVDSWECGSQNWSRNFAEEFRKRRGYDLLPFMPVYAGIPIDGMAEAKAIRVNSEQVLRDVRQTINDLINDVFFVTVAGKAHEYGVQLSSESVAPTMVSDGMEHYKYVDVPMGEYWLNSPTHDKPNDMLDAISGAHVYGKDVVQAEGFTEVRGVWDETPASIKPLLDRNFALGMNRLFFHVFTHNPYMDRKPGMTLDGIGLFFQRDQTWFPEAKALVDYVTRCQSWLQRGRPVADIAVYTGDEMPRRAWTPDKIVPMLPGLFGAERVASERQRMANQGVPMEESPVGVRHSAGILDLKDWINPLHGYQYDSMNKDALLHQPFNYKVLVVPEGCLVSDEVRNHISALRQQGVMIIEKPYAASTLEGAKPDVVLPEGIAYTHRATDSEDIYFLSNQTDKNISFQPLFRADCQQPVLYRPLDDKTIPYDKGTISMHPHEGLFVVFNRQEAPYPMPVTSCLHQRRPGNKLSWSQTSGWDMTFKESGLTLHTDTLFDWSRHADDAIRYFSGHVRYATSFRYKGNTSVKLSLGEVHDLAHVWVNGIDCGIVWTHPYEVDITQALRKGKNRLEIEVVNTWHNALRGLDQGKAPYKGIWTNAKYRTKGNGLLPAGLLSSPRLLIAE